MKYTTKLILSLSLLLLPVFSQGQPGNQPKFAYVATSTPGSIPPSLLRTTNFNPSVHLGDTALAFVADSLRTDGTATIVTVYETDATDIVGLWQVGSDSNRALWLNSQRVSYDNFAFTYRRSNEYGVIVHTMHYQYPAVDNGYDGHDTLFLGREGNTYGDKNLCALLYFPGSISHQYQRQLESALAIRYGALLHGPYINSLSDTLWNPKGVDSLYSFGVCGIGRDDRLSLQQPQSIIRNGILAISAAPLANLEHIMLGSNGDNLELGDEVMDIEAVSYTAVNRQWKLRAHTYGHSSTVHLSIDLPIPVEALRIMVTNGDDTHVVAPDAENLFSLTLADGQDYYLTILVNPAALHNTKMAHGQYGAGEEVAAAANTKTLTSSSNQAISVSPNPTAGNYTVNVNQSDNDIIHIRVVDAAGRTIDQHSSTEPLSHYTYNGHLSTDGIYYVTVTSNGHQQTIKLIVAH